MFVLAAMLMLMAIGVSALTAAGLNHSAVVAQRERTQLDLYVSGMERVIHAALFEDTTGGAVVSPGTLSGFLIRDAYTNGDGRYTFDFELETGLPVELNAAYTVTVTGEMNVRVYHPIPEYEWIEVWGPDPENPTGPQIIVDYEEILVGRSPQIAMINGVFKVTISTVYRSAVPSNGTLSAVTVTMYRFDGGILEEQGYNFNVTTADDSDMYIVDPGIWTVIRHETIDK